MASSKPTTTNPQKSAEENEPSTTNNNNNYTTNAHDLAEAAKLQARLSQYNASNNKDNNNQQTRYKEDDDDDTIPTVFIDEGAHKYVLISAIPPNSTTQQQKQKHFVYSKAGAHYHRNVAEFLIPQLETRGYCGIRVLGGGRIYRDDDDKKISIFGYSYGFGRAPHELSMGVVLKCSRFDGWDVTWSNDGY